MHGGDDFRTHSNCGSTLNCSTASRSSAEARDVAERPHCLPAHVVANVPTSSGIAPHSTTARVFSDVPADMIETAHAASHCSSGSTAGRSWAMSRGSALQSRRPHPCSCSWLRTGQISCGESPRLPRAPFRRCLTRAFHSGGQFRSCVWNRRPACQRIERRVGSMGVFLCEQAEKTQPHLDRGAYRNLAGRRRSRGHLTSTNSLSDMPGQKIITNTNMSNPQQAASSGCI